jgi:VanZ family protein
MIRSPLYPRIALAARVLLGLALAWLLLSGNVVGTLAVAVFLVLSFAYLLRDERLPNVFDLLFSLSALLNAFGFVFNLYRRIMLYDEAAHALTIFAVSLAFFFLFYRDTVPHQRAIAMATAVFTLGVTAGSLWEISEWATGRLFGVEVVYGLSDAITDLIANSLGALVAALVALAIRQRGGRLA